MTVISKQAWASVLLMLACLILATTTTRGAEAAGDPDPYAPPRHDILPEAKWREIRQATDRALDYLAQQQRDDGSFEAPITGQPAITGLCTLAFLANGQLPDQGEHGQRVTKAVNYILGKQKRNGLLSALGPEGPVVRQRGGYPHDIGVAASYNHAISGLVLGEVYGAAAGEPNEPRLRRAIEMAVDFSLQQQKWPQTTRDQGGWRYLHPYVGVNSDLPVTGWQIMMLRSAHNAGFDVPKAAIDQAAEYVLRCFDPGRQMFDYDATGSEGRNRAMAGVGILALAHASHHKRPEARTAADFILREGFPKYNETNLYNPANRSERYHYSVCQCTLAMHQMGGEYWTEYFPPTAESLLANQSADGSWDAESNRDTLYGQSYTTALVVIALSTPNQLLPIFQR
ncbi:MAG: hypothetical protein KDA37_05300 [Planctomycetales bacterium]|nr:hypothetical protein [Planctomycetales bacterium]